MGTSPLPTEAQRLNQKSGKALDRIESSGQKGSFHHVDHLDGMITRVGVMLAELIPFYDDTVGDVTIRTPNDEPATQRINDPKDPNAVMVSPDHRHDITISVGPYAADEREASSDFADTIIGNQALMNSVGPQKAAELNAAAIRLKAVGPIGDEMAEIISPKPPDDQAPPTPQQVQQMQGELQQLQQQLQQAQQAIQTDQAKQQATIEKAKIDNAAMLKKAEADRAFQLEIQRMKDATSLEVARISAKVTAFDSAAAAQEERLSTGLELAHEAAQAAADRAHDVGMATLEHAHALDQASHAQAIQPEPAPEGE